jgi:hypothetical protein
METYVRALQNQPLLSQDMVGAPAPSPEWAPAWAQAHEEAQKAVQKAGEDLYARTMTLNGWPPRPPQQHLRHAPPAPLLRRLTCQN